MMASRGLCECGCGGKTSIAPQTDTLKGWVRGQPVRFLPGHNNRLREHPTGPNHKGWTGDRPSYWAAHKWLNRHYEKAGKCETCGITGKRTEWANKDHLYSRLREDWTELCCSCHAKYDIANGLKPAPTFGKAVV